MLCAPSSPPLSSLHISVSLSLSLTRCGSFCCSGSRGSCGWSARVRVTTQSGHLAPPTCAAAPRGHRAEASLTLRTPSTRCTHRTWLPSKQGRFMQGTLTSRLRRVLTTTGIFYIWVFRAWTTPQCSRRASRETTSPLGLCEWREAHLHTCRHNFAAPLHRLPLMWKL